MGTQFRGGPGPEKNYHADCFRIVCQGLVDAVDQVKVFWCGADCRSDCCIPDKVQPDFRPQYTGEDPEHWSLAPLNRLSQSSASSLPSPVSSRQSPVSSQPSPISQPPPVYQQQPVSQPPPVYLQQPALLRPLDPSPNSSDDPMEALNPRDPNRPSKAPMQSHTSKKTAPVPPIPSTGRQGDKQFHPNEPPPLVLEPCLHGGSGVCYEIGEFLGRGGFAKVYTAKARISKTGGENDEGADGTRTGAEVVALKVVRRHITPAMGAKMGQKFQTELQIHSKMIHENIVRFDKAFSFGDNTYIVLELCPNGSLQQMVHTRRYLTEPEVGFYTMQLASAIKYMHSRGILHRDLKLGNVFLDEKLNAKIGDFGLSAISEDKDGFHCIRRTTVCGTPNYIAPEILEKGRNGHTDSVDLWSLGIIVYGMLIGRPPFQSKNPDEIYEKIMGGKKVWSTVFDEKGDHVSAEGRQVVESLLTKEEKRLVPDKLIELPFLNGECPIPLTMKRSWKSRKPESAELKALATCDNAVRLRHLLTLGPEYLRKSRGLLSKVSREMKKEEEKGLRPEIPLAENSVYRPLAVVLEEIKASVLSGDSAQPGAMLPPRIQPSLTSTRTVPSFAAQQRAESTVNARPRRPPGPGVSTVPKPDQPLSVPRHRTEGNSSSSPTELVNGLSGQASAAPAEPPVRTDAQRRADLAKFAKAAGWAGPNKKFESREVQLEKAQRRMAHERARREAEERGEEMPEEVPKERAEERALPRSMATTNLTGALGLGSSAASSVGAPGPSSSTRATVGVSGSKSSTVSTVPERTITRTAPESASLGRSLTTRARRPTDERGALRSVAPKESTGTLGSLTSSTAATVGVTGSASSTASTVRERTMTRTAPESAFLGRSLPSREPRNVAVDEPVASRYTSASREPTLGRSSTSRDTKREPVEKPVASRSFPTSESAGSLPSTTSTQRATVGKTETHRRLAPASSYESYGSGNSSSPAGSSRERSSSQSRALQIRERRFAPGGITPAPPMARSQTTQVVPHSLTRSQTTEDMSTLAPRPVLNGSTSGRMPSGPAQHTTETSNIEPYGMSGSMLFLQSMEAKRIDSTLRPAELAQLKAQYYEIDRSLRSRSTASSHNAPKKPLVFATIWIDDGNNTGLGYALSNGATGCLLRRTGVAGGPHLLAHILIPDGYRHLKTLDDLDYEYNDQLVCPPDSQDIYISESRENDGWHLVQFPATHFETTPSIHPDNDSPYIKERTTSFHHRIDAAMESYIRFSRRLHKRAKWMADTELPDTTPATFNDGVKLSQRFGDTRLLVFFDGHLQVNFPDHTKVIIDKDGYWCDFHCLTLGAVEQLKKDGTLTTASRELVPISFPLQTLLNCDRTPPKGSTRHVRNPQPSDSQRVLLSANDLRPKIKFIVQILHTWNLSDVPGYGLTSFDPRDRLVYQGMRDMGSRYRSNGNKGVWYTIGAQGADHWHSIDGFDYNHPERHTQDTQTLCDFSFNDQCATMLECPREGSRGRCRCEVYKHPIRKSKWEHPEIKIHDHPVSTSGRR